MHLTATGFHEQSLHRLGDAIRKYGNRHETAGAQRTDEDRQQAAKEGAALPDGSYVVRNKQDLHQAVADSGLKGHPSAAREHIVRRATALGLGGELPHPWQDHGYTH